MTDSLEKIQQEELQLERDLDQIEDEEKQLKQIEDEYEEFFHHASSLFTEMGDQFLQNDFHWYLNDRFDNLSQRKLYIINELGDEQQQRHKQQLLIEDKKNDLFYQRKTLLANKEERTNGR